MRHTFLLVPALVVSALFAANSAFAATFAVVPDALSAPVGSDAVFTVVIDTEGAAVNAAQGRIQYPADLLTVTSIDTSDSIFNFWIDAPSFSNDAGTIRFLGGATNGFNGSSLRVFRIHATVEKEGAGGIVFTDGAITASDGSGSNVLGTMYGATVTGTAVPVEEAPPTQIVRTPVPAATAPARPVVSIPLYPDEDAWHGVLSPFIASWELPSDVSAVATSLDQNPGTVPKVAEGLFDNKIFRVGGDGVWYLHVRFRNNVGWGETAHARIAVDSLPPSAFDIEVDPGFVTDVPTPTIAFGSSDQLSGLRGYEVRVDGEAAVETGDATYTFAPLSPGTHLVSVSAVDEAGNSTSASVEIETIPIAAPTLSPIPAEVYVGEGQLSVGGTAQQGVEVSVRLSSATGELVGTAAAAPDENGTWSARFDQPLRRGTYVVSVVARDDRGATSLPVTASFGVEPRPFLVLGGVTISEWWVFLAVVLLLLAGYVAGWYVQRKRAEQRGSHVLIAQREVDAAFSQVQKDLKFMLAKYKGPLGEAEEAEMRVRVKRMHDRIQKIKQYILDHIGEIGE